MAGLPPLRYHDLRHGAASLMAAQGVPVRTAMQLLGHAQVSTTMNICAHVAPELMRDSAERVARALWEWRAGLLSRLLSPRQYEGGREG